MKMAIAFKDVDLNFNLTINQTKLHRVSYKRLFYRTFDKKRFVYSFSFLAIFLFMFQILIDGNSCSNVSTCLSGNCSFEDTHKYPYGIPIGNGSRLPIPGTNQRLPEVLIIGVRKGGTRALLEMLNLHPDIQKVPMEVHFFDRTDRHALGLEWYRHQMPFTFEGQLTVEKSPSYFITPEAPKRVYKMNSSAKLLLIVRDPVVRLLSDFAQIEATRSEWKKKPRSFEDVALLSNGSVNFQYKAIQHPSLGKLAPYLCLAPIYT
ncbi:hypothetical protein QYM36_018432 [Artemia franciscana]|uniref:Sulfotransferase domain-containing protein n=1 Tax=Artemia franciscana TaxID=6661 RepID=A0AA88HCX6_ARTSF|nr:hypothetical protein QYM36_018432 [Artemia franciscana]